MWDAEGSQIGWLQRRLRCRAFDCAKETQDVIMVGSLGRWRARGKTIPKSSFSAQAQAIATATVAAGKSNDLLHHVDVRPTRFLGGHEEFGIAGEPGIRICLDYIHFSFGSKPHVDAPVVAKLKRVIGVDGDLLKAFDSFLIEVLRWSRLCDLVSLSVFLPLHFGSSHFGHALGKFREIKLNQRERLRIFISQNGSIDFASLDVFLNEGGRIKLLLDVVNPLHQFLYRGGDGELIDADGTIFRGRLHD